jgi:site-specific recombinase XerD
LNYLADAHPQVRRLGQLRRDPHIVGWLRNLSEQNPPLANETRRNGLLNMRRLLEDLAWTSDDPPEPGLILASDLPPADRYLPRPLSPENDRLLQQQLRTQDDLFSNALLLLRLTGLRIGEGVSLSDDCLRCLDETRWALHVPIGKLHTERWVPADDDIRSIVARIQRLRDSTLHGVKTPREFLLPQDHGHDSLCGRLRERLATTARLAGCSTNVTPHRMRHTYATEMLHAGVSLPALQQLLGHKSINMTMRYLEVTQIDLQREYYNARLHLADRHVIPQLPTPPAELLSSGSLGIPAITKALDAVRHLLEMYRRHNAGAHLQSKLHRLTNRLVKIAAEIESIEAAD